MNVERALLMVEDSRPAICAALRRSSVKHQPSSRAFTLTEILIVIALIVLMLALALPAFNFITGGRSVDAAQNQIAAFLSRARTEAIGLQEPRGLMFFIDPKTPDRVSIALVRATDTKTGVDDPNVEAYLDLVSDSDFLQLPRGVGLQMVDDYAVDASKQAQDDRYIGFNRTSATAVAYGGIILFDGTGLLKSATYGFRCSTGAAASGPPTNMGLLLYQLQPASSTYTPPNQADFVPRRAAANPPPRSQFGLVVFDLPTFENKSLSRGDPQIDATIPVYSATAGNAEYGEESWLDGNATPVLINRYNGTLVKGE
jgi:prepilin-type N-terminal cleavage/methylation domain-containing protein